MVADEQFSCQVLVNLWPKIIAFGALVGLAWSFVPGALSELFRGAGQTITVVVSGIFTGATVSLLFKRPLSSLGPSGAFALGVASLPLGGFVFGVVISCTHVLVRLLTGVQYRFAYDFSPFRAGIEYAVMSCISVFTIVLLPMAILTTYLLFRVTRGVSHGA